jgi:hypothetical protein
MAFRDGDASLLRFVAHKAPMTRIHRVRGKSPMGSAEPDEAHGVVVREDSMFRIRFDHRKAFNTENTEHHGEYTETRITLRYRGLC